MENNRPSYGNAHVSDTQTLLIKNVYTWMTAALAVTGLTAYGVANSYSLSQVFANNSFLFYIILFAELGLVWYISARIHSISFATATGLFMLYSLLNGAVMSFVFTIYTQESIASTFFVTAATFGVMSVYGYFTKRDLTSWGNLLFMALVGLIIASVINIFWGNGIMNLIISGVGVLIFVGLTAYDTQKIKALAGQEINEMTQKLAVLGALTLYLDFVNMFLYLLRFLGNRK